VQHFGVASSAISHFWESLYVFMRITALQYRYKPPLNFLHSFFYSEISTKSIYVRFEDLLPRIWRCTFLRNVTWLSADYKAFYPTT
jgi:hypothetical protein